MPGPTYGKRLGKQTNRKQRKRRNSLGYGKGGAFGSGRLSTRRRKERSGRGAFKYAGMYKGSTQDAINRVPESTRKRRADKSMSKAIRLKHQEDLIRGVDKPTKINVRGYEARYDKAGTKQREQSEIKRYKNEKYLRGQGKRLRYILGRPLKAKDIKLAKTAETNDVRDRQIKKLETRVKGYDRMIADISKVQPNKLTDAEKTDFWEAGLTGLAKNNPEEIVKNKNSYLTAIRARRAEDRAQLERLLKRRAQGDVVRYTRNLRATPRANAQKRERLSRRIRESKKEIKWRQNVNQKRLDQRKKERLADEEKLRLSQLAVTSKKGVDATFLKIANTAIKASKGKQKQELIDMLAAIKANKHPNPQMAILRFMEVLNEQVGGGMRSNYVHPLIKKFDKEANMALAYQKMAESYGLNAAETWIGSVGGGVLLALDLATVTGVAFKIGKAGLGVAGRIGFVRALREAGVAGAKDITGALRNRATRLGIREGLAESALKSRSGKRVAETVASAESKTSKLRVRRVVDPEKVTPKSAGQAAARDNQVADEIISSAQAGDVESSVNAASNAYKSGKLGKISDELKQKFDDFLRYQEEAAAKIKNNPRAAGSVNQKLTRMRNDIAQQLLKDETFARRGLAAPLKRARYMTSTVAKVSKNYALDAAYKARWTARIGLPLILSGEVIDQWKNDGEFTRNFAHNVQDFGAAMPYIILDTAKMGSDIALRGDFSRAEALWDYMKEHDALFLTAQAFTNGEWDKVGQAIEARPFDALLSFGMGYGIVGKALGRGARLAGKLPRYKEIALPDGSIVQRQRKGNAPILSKDELKTRLSEANSGLSKLGIRAGYMGQLIREPLPLILTDSPKMASRRYSPNFITAQVQRFMDNRDLARVSRIQMKADSGAKLTKYEKRQLVAHEIRQRDMFIHLVNDDIDKHYARDDLKNRAEVSKLDETFNKIANDLSKPAIRGGLGKGSHEALRPLASLEFGGPNQVVEVMTQALADAKQLKQDLYRKNGNQTSPEYYGVSNNIRLMERLLDNPEWLTSPKMWDAVNKVAEQINPLEDELVAAGKLLPQQRDFAPLVPYAVRVMGAKAVKVKNNRYIFVIDAVKNKATGKMGEAKTLTADDIRAHMRANGIENDPVFFSSREYPDLNNPELRTVLPDINSQRFEASTSAELISTFRHDLTFEDIKKQAIIDRLGINKTASVDLIINKYLVGDETGKFFKSLGEADRFLTKNADNFPIDYEPFIIQVVDDEIKVEGILRAGDVNTTSPVITSLDEYLRADTPYAGNRDLFRDGNPWDQSGQKKMIDDLAKEIGITNKAKYGYKVGLLPTQVRKRLHEHIRIDEMFQTNAGKFITTLTREFKGAVLPFAITWHVGNLVDMSMRMMFEGVTPSDALVGLRLKRMLKKDYPDLYEAVLIEMGGGHLISAKGSVIRGRDMTIVKGENRLGLPTIGQMDKRTVPFTGERPRSLSGPLGGALFSAEKLQPYEKAVLNTSASFLHNVVRQDQRLFRTYKSAAEFGFKLGEIAEETLRFATFGKEGRRLLEELGTGWFESARAGNAAIQELAIGLYDENKLSRLGDYTNKVLGDYTKMSPNLRLAVRTLIPFGLWLRASATWIVTLPYRHPVKTGFAAQVRGLTEEERRTYGLSVFGNNVVPHYLLGSIPFRELPDWVLPGPDTEIDPLTGERQDKYMKTNSYTSFGPFYGDITNLLSFVAPFWTTAFNAAYNGIDWTGEVIRNPDGSELTGSQKIQVAMYGAMETYFYPMSYIHALSVGGKPSPSSIPFLAPRRDYRFYGPQNTPGEMVIWDKYLGRNIKLKDFYNDRDNPFNKFFNPFRGLPYKPNRGSNDSRGLGLSDYKNRRIGSENLLGQTKSRFRGLDWRYVDPNQNKKAAKKTNPLDNYR